MRKVIVSNVVSLDGFFEGPEKNLDWFVVSDEFFKYAGDMLNEASALLFGRVTYELMVAFWPNATGEDPVVTEKMNSLPKIVFSKTLAAVDWNNSRLVANNIAEEISALKQQPGKDLVILGSGSIVSQFAQLGLIDEYRIIVTPVILGSGNGQFKNTDRLSLKLVETKTFKSGVVILYYQPK